MDLVTKEMSLLKQERKMVKYQRCRRLEASKVEEATTKSHREIMSVTV